MNYYYSTDPSVLVQRTKRIAENLFYYFYHLEEHIQNAEDFKENWSTIPDSGLTRKNLILILSSLEKNLFSIGKDNPELARACLRHVLENFNLWERAVLSKNGKLNALEFSSILMAHAKLGINVHKRFLVPLIDTRMNMDVRDSASIKWSSAVLSSQFPDEDYKRVYENTPNIHRFSSVGSIQQKQFHDAQIWFERKTDIENPIRPETRGHWENRLSNIFNDAGLQQRENSHTLNNFRLAGDLCFTDGQTEIHIEDDGLPHFFYNYKRATGEMAYTGKSKFRGILVEQQNPEARILHIPYNVPLRIKQDCGTNYHLITSCFRSLFEQCVQAEPGAYRAFYSNRQESIEPFAKSADGDLWASPYIHARPA